MLAVETGGPVKFSDLPKVTALLTLYMYETHVYVGDVLYHLSIYEGCVHETPLYKYIYSLCTVCVRFLYMSEGMYFTIYEVRM